MTRLITPAQAQAFGGVSGIARRIERYQARAGISLADAARQVYFDIVGSR